MKSFYILALFAIALTSGHAGTLIDPATLNGSFESGQLSPWSGGTAVYDPANAPDGDWYAQTVALVSRASIYVFFTAPDTANKDFTLTFSARAVAGEFQELAPYVYGRTEGNGFLYASVISNSATAVGDEWTAYSYLFSFSQDWDTTKDMSVGFDFSSGSADSVGLIDNVAFSQVPEPSAAIVFISMGALLYSAIRRARRGRPLR